MNTETRLNYLEFATPDMNASKIFFTSVFGWYFKDYGSEYAAFFAGEAGIDGGLYSVAADTWQNHSQGPLPVFFSPTLEITQEEIIQAGGEITRPVYTFPGGRRFHFREPGGNELAVWSHPLPDS